MGAEPATFLFLARPSREAQGAHCSGITVPRKGGSLNRQREGSAQGADGVPGGREGERRGVGMLPLRLMGAPNASLAGTGALEPERDVVAMARTHFTHPQPHSSDKQFVLCTYEHFYFFKIPYMRDHAVSAFLCLTLHNALEVHSCGYTWQAFALFHG